jgi:dihydropteroate synthase
MLLSYFWYMQNQDENSFFRENLSLNFKGDIINFSTAKVMGILNLSPDSFFDGGKFQQEKAILKQVELMLEEGADIIDVGAFSSRPGAKLISEQEEVERLKPALKNIIKAFPNAILSIDTYRSAVAKASIEEGAAIINDISAGNFDDKMFETIADLGVPYILMHMQGKPETMQNQPTYENVSTELFEYFHLKLKQLNALGVNDIILDPGFGFGKSMAHNYTLLKDLSYFQKLNTPILVGLSRKGMIQKVIEKKAEEALNGTTAAHVIALLNGANILRVHDVKEAKEAIQIVDYYQKH